ncbi:MAG: hypothetical protein D3923_03490 [Candidatus Electrothrix sp. AR3]|nr:hypothetical protein [Candidatus Electrothrix sp. AR3]
MPDSNVYQQEQEERPLRVLFLRSSTQSTFAAFIAGGLHHTRFDFMQYPPFPDNNLDKLKKLYDSSSGQKHLEHNLIAGRKELREKLEQGYFDLILLLDYDARLFRYAQMNTLKKLRNLLGQCKNIFRGSLADRVRELNYMRGLPFTPAELNTLAPVAVVDLDDWICLPPQGQNLLRHCSSYYKRELPFNRFFLYYQQRPAPWRVWRKKLAPVCAKARNIPLGVEDKKYYDLKARRKDKQEIDIFYCGLPTSSPRLTALEQLKKMAITTKWNIVIADTLPFNEYCDIISRSKITISISGGGWDCFRHYEAVALGSLPLMDRPVVDAIWWQNLPDVLFFSNTFQNFQNRIDTLLSDASLRNSCLTKLEKVFESHMLHSKIVEHIVSTSLKG